MGRSMAGVRGSLVDHGAYKLSLPMGWTMDRSMGYPSNVDLSVITDTLVCFIRVFFFFFTGRWLFVEGAIDCGGDSSTMGNVCCTPPGSRRG